MQVVAAGRQPLAKAHALALVEFVIVVALDEVRRDTLASGVVFHDILAQALPPGGLAFDDVDVALVDFPPVTDVARVEHVRDPAVGTAVVKVVEFLKVLGGAAEVRVRDDCKAVMAVAIRDTVAAVNIVGDEPPSRPLCIHLAELQRIAGLPHIAQ